MSTFGELGTMNLCRQEVLSVFGHRVLGEMSLPSSLAHLLGASHESSPETKSRLGE